VVVSIIRKPWFHVVSIMFGFLVAGMIRWVFNHYKPCFDVLATVATAEIGIAGKLGPCYPLGPRSCGWFQRKSKRSILILLKDALLVKDMR
jgi:hypothetical protein